MVFFEAPHRLDASVRDMADAFGMDRRAAVCRELTKTYEEVLADASTSVLFRMKYFALSGWFLISDLKLGFLCCSLACAVTGSA